MSHIAAYYFDDRIALALLRQDGKTALIDLDSSPLKTNQKLDSQDSGIWIHQDLIFVQVPRLHMLARSGWRNSLY